MRSIHLITSVAWLFLAGAGARAADHRIVIYDDKATEVAVSTESSPDLWVTLADLTRATKFELKPEGVCRDQQRFPLPADGRKDFVAQRGSTTWFNLSAFARLLKQPVAHDAKHGVWYFGPRPEEQNDFRQTLQAPNFTLPDITGKMHSLSDFRGKKVLLFTWASW